jgi:hypothetical protein
VGFADQRRREVDLAGERAQHLWIDLHSAHVSGAP